MLFHLTDQDDLTELVPKIPRVNPAFENDTTPRICFAPSINSCLRALNVDTYYSLDRNRYRQTDNPWDEFVVSNERDMATVDLIYNTSKMGLEAVNMSDYIEKNRLEPFPIYHVYVPLDVQYADFIVPYKDEVYDREYTQEVWLLNPCKVKKITSIMVVGTTDIFKKTVYRTDRKTGHRVRGTYTLRDYEYRTISAREVSARTLMVDIVDQCNIIKPESK